nr:hypothetical protein [Tanacetum cinerariifolium]
MRLTPFFKAFLVTTDVLKIYMQEFWVTAIVHHHSIRFKMENKKHIVNLESFREMLHICPRLPHQPFVELPFEEEILAFLCFLGHNGAIRRLTDVEHKDTKKSNEMYYPRFTKVIIHHFMSKDPSIPRRNKVNWHYVRDDHMFSTIKLVSRHQNTQQFGALLPIELTNEDISNSNAYKEYYAVATRVTPPKPKASVQKTRSSSDTTITPPTAAVGKDSDGDDDDNGDYGEEGDGDDDDEDDDGEEGSDDDEGKDSDGDDDDNGDDGKEGDGDDDDEHDDGEEGNDDDDDQEDEGDDDKDDEKKGGDDEQASDKEEFIHPSLSTHTEEEPRDEESFDPIPKNLKILMMKAMPPTSVAPLPMSTPTITPSTITTITTTQQAPLPPTIAPKENFSEFSQTNQFAGAVSAIPGIVQRYMDQRMNEAVKVSVQIQSDLLRDEAQADNDKKVYKALVEAYESDKIILDTYKDTITLKRRHDDDTDRDEEPFAGSDRGSKRRKEGKEPESASTTFEMEEPSHLEFETGADDQPTVQSSQHLEWFSQQQKPPTPNCDWSKTLLATHGSIQPWISELAKQSDSRSSFNELMDTPMDFFDFLLNRLRVDTLTPELLAGPIYELMKGSCKSLVELEYQLEEVYKATTDQLDWVNPKGASSRKYTNSVTKTKVVDYGHIKWIEDLVPKTMWIQEPIGYDKHALWGISYWGRKRQHSKVLLLTGSLIVIQRHVKDLQLGVESYQKKLNLTTPDTYHSDLKRKEAYIAYSNPRGFIYQNKDKKNRLIRIDELHKFSDGTLNDVRTALDDRLKGIQMQYLP